MSPLDGQMILLFAGRHPRGRRDRAEPGAGAGGEPEGRLQQLRRQAAALPEDDLPPPARAAEEARRGLRRGTRRLSQESNLIEETCVDVKLPAKIKYACVAKAKNAHGN